MEHKNSHFSEIDNAVNIAIIQGRASNDDEAITELERRLRPRGGFRYDVEAVTEHADELRDLCAGEVEEAFVNTILDSLSNHKRRIQLIGQYGEQWDQLSARHRRVRNAVVHGNAAVPAVVESVRDVSEFLSSYALEIATDAHANGETPVSLLERIGSERGTQ